jgi:DNA-binding MarR family transcriptional regulator
MSGLLGGWDWFDNALQNILREEGFRPLNKSQSMMIIYIFAGVRRPAEIARKMRLSRQAIRYIEKQLVCMGMIRSIVDPDDRRSKILVLSDDAMDHRSAARRIIFAMEHSLAQRIGIANVAALRAVLDLDWGPTIRSSNDLLESVEDPSFRRSASADHS